MPVLRIHHLIALYVMVDGRYTAIQAGPPRSQSNHDGYRSALLPKLHKLFGTIFVVVSHYKQRRQLLTKTQLRLLRMGPKIEGIFDYLKEHLHLQSSFPRSVQCFAPHYVRILLGYQLLELGW